MTLPRRAWLQGALALSACGGATRAPALPRAVDVPPDLSELLALAASAPSRHNEQPWRVTLLGTGSLVVRAKPSLRLAVDRHGVAAPLALGAFVQHLRVAAARAGRAVDVEVDDGAARVTLRPAAPVPFDARLFATRATSRDEYADVELGSAEVAPLLAASDSLHFVPRASPEGTRLVEATLEGARAQLGRREARAELARWVHLDDEDAERLGDGYTLASLGVTGSSAFAVRTFLGAAAFEDQRFTSRALARTSRHLARFSGFLVVTAPARTFPALLAAGEALGQAALALHGAGLAMHPMVQAVEEGDPARVAADAGLGGMAVMVARLGRPTAPVVRRTFRRPPAAFVELPEEDGGGS